MLQVKRIDYYQRTDQALSQFLSGEHGLSDVTTYLHGDGLLTLRVARLPEGQELPGADQNQIWFWLRPRQVPASCSTAWMYGHGLVCCGFCLCLWCMHLFSTEIQERRLPLPGI
jgi:hypothetical protein